MMSVGDQVQTAGRAVIRARSCLDLWSVTARAESRLKFSEPIEEFWEPLRFIEHANLLTYSVTICSVFDKRRDCLRLDEIARRLGAGERLISEIGPTLEKVKVLRNEIYAHQSLTSNWKHAFSRANVTPNEMERLGEGALEAVNAMLAKLGLRAFIWSGLPRSEFERLLSVSEAH